jgi:hypothetical protein
LQDPFTLSDVQKAVQQSKIGLTQNRVRGIWKLYQTFKLKPNPWIPLPNEGNVDYRNRLSKFAVGIGMAKTSFGIELIDPLQSDVVCLDVHMLRLYFGDKVPNFTPNPRLYVEVEKHWSTECKKLNVPCAIARHIYWDKVQNQRSTKYWSHVFHNFHEKSFINV